MARKNLMFKHAATFTQGDVSDQTLWSDELMVEFAELAADAYGPGEPQRHAAQRPQFEAFEQAYGPGARAIFGALFTWPYRGFTVGLQRQRSVPAEPTVLGDRPTQATPHHGQGTAPTAAVLGASSAKVTATEQKLCLFNVVVALEWMPSRRQRGQLEWAFRRASNFLYDVTDGAMAFGQVVFGGDELLDSADIVITASNRYLPRSWVDGLNEARKFMPIRLGRGIWNKNRRFCIPWDEPEGYRTIVHEWGHYALGLKDLYLQKTPWQHEGYDYNLIVPVVSLPVESIMLSLEGISELAPKQSHPSLPHTRDEPHDDWSYIEERFPFLRNRPDRDNAGPGELPLPLPQFHWLSTLPAAQHKAAPSHQHAEAAPQAAIPEREYRLRSSAIALDHCWVYLLQAVDGDPYGRLVAQGSLESQPHEDTQANDRRLVRYEDANMRAALGDLPLLGARPGDTVVLIGDDESSESASFVIKKFVLPEDDTTLTWDAIAASPNCAPAEMPFVDVIPLHDARVLDAQEQAGAYDPFAQLWVRIVYPSGAGVPPADISIFPLSPFAEADRDNAVTAWKMTQTPQAGDGGFTTRHRPARVRNLDGHVLVRWGAGDDEQLLICGYSQGGGPGDSGFPVCPNPIPAGSSDGNALLFFAEDPCDGARFKNVRVVTTRQHGPIGAAPAERTAMRSYAYSMASNWPFEAALTPTLVMFYDNETRADSSARQVYRHDGKAWTPLGTYEAPVAPFLAVPLHADEAPTAPHLFQADGPRIERYRIFAKPGA